MDSSIVALSLAFFIIPAATFFYSLIRPSDLGQRTYILVMGSIVVCTVFWVLVGYSFAYGQNDLFGIISDPASGFLLNFSYFGTTQTDAVAATGSTVDLVGASYHLLGPIFASILIAGGLDQRVRFLAFCSYIAAYVALFYTPLTHMIRGGGLMDDDGIVEQIFGRPVHDFAGASSILIGSSIAAMVLLAIMNRTSSRTRKHTLRNAFGHFGFKYATQSHVEVPLTQTSVRNQETGERTMQATALMDTSVIKEFVVSLQRQTFQMFGLLLLVFGWMACLIGRVAAQDSAGVVWLNILILIVSSIAGWFLIEKIMVGTVTMHGMMLSTISGLSCATALADVVSPGMSFIIGLLTAVLVFMSTALLKRFIRTAALIDNIAAILFGGAYGYLFVGIFGTSGLFMTWNGMQFVVQLLSLMLIAGYALVVSFLFGILINRVIGFRSE